MTRSRRDRREALGRAVAGAIALGAGVAGLSLGTGSSLAPAPPGVSAPSPSPSTAPAPAPAVTDSPAASPLPLDGVTVVLDPGHNAGNAAAPGIVNAQVPDGRGGTKACNTVGTATADGYPEYAFTYDVADRARTLLVAAGARVTLTRGPDGVGPCVDIRGQSAALADADALVSLHGDGSENPAVAGFYAITVASPLNDAQAEPSRLLAADLVASLTAQGFTPSGLAAGGVTQRDDLATLNFSERPAVLLELAEFHNPAEAAAVQDEAVRQRYAQAVADGVTQWALAQH